MYGFRKSSYTKKELHEGQHRFEHWYRDNSVYFITSKVRDGLHAFKGEPAQLIFWDRLLHYLRLHGFAPWIVTLMSNHYHILGFLKDGEQLGEMMRKIHGSVAWLVMKDLDVHHVPFWRTKGNKDYFDGCIRDVLQAERAFNYVRDQAVKAKLVRDWREYSGTRVYVERDEAIAWAARVGAYLEEVPYARYERKKKRGHRR